MSGCKEILSRGPEINVCIESTFDEGMVVSYTDQTGQEYRGALLSLTPVHTSKSCEQAVGQVSQELANPLTYVHDHPYSDLTRYAKYVSKIPSEVVMNWNTASNSYNLDEIGTRRQKLATVPLRAEPDRLSMPQTRSSNVLINPANEIHHQKRHRHHRDFPTVSGRAAKINANSRIFGVIDDMIEWNTAHFQKHKPRTSSWFKGKDPKHKAKGIAMKKPKNKRHTFSPRVPALLSSKKKRPVTASPTPGSDIPSPKPKPRVFLKDFSIPLVRVKVCYSTPPSTTSVSPSPPPESVSSGVSEHSSFSITSSGSRSTTDSSNISSSSSSIDSYTPCLIVVD